MKINKQYGPLDIIIKSFNRPYYLERCIRSIHKYVEGEYKIRVLDDGTPPEYLKKIAELFPNVEIHTSPLYEKKWRALKEHVSGGEHFDLYFIPIDFWIYNIKRSSDYFLLLEDDIWLTGKIYLNPVIEVMKSSNMVKLKTSWQGNNKVNQGTIFSLSNEVEEIKPSITLIDEVRLVNRFKLGSLLFRLRLLRNDLESILPFYSLYAVASAFFEKKYWLGLWEHAGLKVNERFQLIKALEWYKSHDSTYGKLKVERAKTSYITSATNNFSNVKFDMLYFNNYINNFWLNEKFNTMENFPEDFSPEIIRFILEEVNDPMCYYSEWLRWVAEFKGQYEKIGCKVN